MVFSVTWSSCQNEKQDETEQNTGSGFADVTAITSQVSSNGYNFSVTLSSPDTGCNQYADWWEVLSEDGALIYRRILTHSHVDEQPFTRSGGPIDIAEDQVVWVRGHMNNAGYGGQVMKGSPGNGFSITDFPDDIAKDVDKQDPLPDGCRF